MTEFCIFVLTMDRNSDLNEIRAVILQYFEGKREIKALE